MSRHPFPRFSRALLTVAAAALAGCASSDRMIRLSPLSDAKPEAGRQAGAAQESRLGARTLTDDRVNAFPLYYTTGAMTSVCWPLVDWDDRGWAVRPFYNRDGDNRSVLFPLCAWDKTSGWALNTVWDEEKGWMFAPFFGSWDKTDFVFPVFVTARPGEASPAVRVFPVWYSDAKEESVTLLYTHRHDAREESHEVLFGLLYNDTVSASGDERSSWLFPVGFHRRDKVSSEWLTLPYGGGHDEKHAWSNIHPLWWTSEGPGWSRECLLPFWFTRVNGDDRATYTPFGFSRSRGADAETTTWLFGYGHDAGGSWFNIHPLWWSSSSSEGRSRLLFPVYYDVSSPEGSGVYTPLGFRTHAGERTNTVTWLYSRGGDSRERWFNVHPLWWSWSGGRESVDVLIPLYLRVDDGKVATAYTPLGFHETSGDDSRWLTLPFSAGHAGGRSWMNLHPLWWSSDAENDSMRALFPLYYSRRSQSGRMTCTPLSFYEGAGEDYRLVTLPYSAGRAGGRTWSNIHPLWWSSDSPDGSLRALLPFYYMNREGDATDSYTWLGYHGTKGESSRWVTPLFSSGHDGKRSWLNIHPLWWSSEDDKRSVDTLLPLWSRERLTDGSGSVLTPLGYSEYGPGGERRFLNVLGLGYQWNRESETVVSTHVLWPIYAGRHATTDVDATFVGRFALVANETAPNLDAFRVTPLWSSAGGPGVSSVRDWLHLVSRRSYAGETSTTVTPLAEFVANDADGRWRVTPLASSAELQDDTCWRDWLHLVSARRDERGSSYTLTPLCQRRRAHEASEFRLTPLVDTGTGKYAPMNPWTPHLFVHGRDGERRFWSVTPLVGGMRTPQGESEYAWPLYRYESRGGDTVSRMVFPFYAEGEDDTFPESLCLVRRLRTPEEETRSWFGPVWRRRIFHARPEPDAGLLSAPMRIPTDRTGGLFTSETRYLYRSLDTSAFAPEELTLLRRWRDEESRLRALEVVRLRPDSGEAQEVRRYWSAGTEAAMVQLHESMLELLRRREVAPAVETVDAMQASVVKLVAAHAHAKESYRFAVDPLWINLYHEEEEPGYSSWTFLFGLGRGEIRNGYGRSSVLSYLYTKEVAPDGVRMNCFPFIQCDETTTRRKVSFLWRVWNRETDRATGKVKGHVFFIPY